MKEQEIRPQALFDQYLALAREDAVTYFAQAPKARVPCPSCGAGDSAFAFEKYGFPYELCPRCDTLFVNPRPHPEAFARYYTEAPSTKFWATNFYKETEAARREKMFRPRARLVLDIAARYGAPPRTLSIADIGAGYGVFCEEIAAQAPPGTEVLAIEPSPLLSEVCRTKGLAVVPRFLEDVTAADLPSAAGRMRILTSFELFEHLHTPLDFMRRCHELLAPGDLLVLTTLSGRGFDIQLLWERSKSVHPPHHVNFANPDALATLARRAGLEPLEVTTPGKLDVSIVENNLADVSDRLMRTFFQTATDQAREELQAFLQRHRLSSHMMLVARRP